MRKRILLSVIAVVAIISTQLNTYAQQITFEIRGAISTNNLAQADGQVNISKNNIDILLTNKDNKENLTIVVPIDFAKLTGYSDAYPGDNSYGSIQIRNESGEEYEFESARVEYGAKNFSTVYNSALAEIEKEMGLGDKFLQYPKNWSSLTSDQLNEIETKYYAKCEEIFGKDKLENPTKDNTTQTYLLQHLFAGVPVTGTGISGNAVRTETDEKLNTIAEKLLFNQCISFFVGNNSLDKTTISSNKLPIANYKNNSNAIFQKAFSDSDKLSTIGKDGLTLKYGTEISGKDTGNFFQNVEYQIDYVITLKRVSNNTPNKEPENPTEDKTKEPGKDNTDTKPVVVEKENKVTTPSTNDDTIAFFGFLGMIASSLTLLVLLRMRFKQMTLHE